jgi:hypothetical protein
MDDIGVTILRNGQKITVAEYRRMMGLDQPTPERPHLSTLPIAKGRKPSEHAEQVALMKICKEHEVKYPELKLLHAIPNGGQRHVAVAAKLKAEGVKAGVPDLFLPAPRGNAHGLYIEMKKPGGSVTQAQRRMMAALAAQGYACLVCYGWENAWREIEAYLKSKVVHIGVLK